MFINVHIIANSILDQLISFVNCNVAIDSVYEDFIKSRDLLKSEVL